MQSDRHPGASEIEMRELALDYQLPMESSFADSDDDVSRPSTADRSKGGRPRNGSAAIILAESLRKALA
jgi:hypothetical protein